MTEKPTPNDRPTHHRQAVAILFVVTLAVLGTISGLAVAQDLGDTWEDDFEDGTTDGWSSQNPSLTTSGDSVTGDQSLYVEAREEGEGVTTWNDGPLIDMQEEFTMRGVSRNSFERDDDPLAIRLGIAGGDRSEPGANAILIFNQRDNATFLGTYAEDELESGDDRYEGVFQDEWVAWEIHSEAGSETLQAKVWEYGETEPTQYELEREFEGVAGQFYVDVGFEEHREFNLDQINIEGQQAPGDPNLSIETRSLIRHGETQAYTVERTVYDEDLAKNVTRDVTDNASVESLNPDGLTVNEDNQTLTATSDEEFQDRVTVRAEESGDITHTEVAVADITMDNIEILPTEYRFSAVLNAGAFQVILISVFAGIIGTRWSTAFGGLGMMQLVLVAGWFGGWISTGIVLVGLFTSMFIGLNLAANIDYTVRR